MRVIDALHAPWAVRPETLRSMVEIYERHAAGESFDVKAIEAAIGGKPLNSDPQAYTVTDGVAILNCIGVMGKRFDLFTQICGGTSTQRLQEELQTALDDPTVHSIVLLVDSPGGEVDGTQALAADVFNARNVKPIVSLIDGQGASGAYWVASSASKVFITADTAIVGSIGVVLAHTDVSKAQDMRGVKTTEITAGKYKRIASQFAPLTPEGRQSLQNVVDHIYSVFVDDVARNRGMSAEQVIADMADGRIFLGQQAVSAGLADGISTLSALIETLNTPASRTQNQPGASVPGKSNNEVKEMEKVFICGAECGTQEAVDAAVANAITAAKAEATTAATSAAVTAERTRIVAIQGLALVGHEKLITEAIANGTPHADVAVSLVAAEKEKRAKVAANLTDDAPPVVPPAGAPPAGTTTEPSAQEVADKAKAYQAEEATKGRKLTASEAVAHVRKQLGLK